MIRLRPMNPVPPVTNTVSIRPPGAFSAFSVCSVSSVVKAVQAEALPQRTLRAQRETREKSKAHGRNRQAVEEDKKKRRGPEAAGPTAQGGSSKLRPN